eukprot:CAMPEP_0206377022 /NCGR_PEP_ID=MMETSP0294-20121207/9890_1 /ASSEMBLY_ACC=CAM_ASM_000327 /TAXON_ID=39354 /ORGANISM="Heterosigma akashiwo, Strain CCMP2393" /LENGTH=37 /DNA_ID= /DNA_START= /DNA_END= /DNA_ORIENTATION=
MARTCAAFLKACSAWPKNFPLVRAKPMFMHVVAASAE